MEGLIDVLRVVHIVNAILMAWPFYALVAVNQRGRLGLPLGDRADVYMENTLKNRIVPCFVFQGTALASGVALVLLRGHGLDALVSNPALGAKFLLLLLIGGLLSYVHFGLQPRIDALFAAASSPVPREVAARIGVMRLRRKRMASLCLFSVLTTAMLGVQVWAAFELWLTGLLLLAIALFTWRAYKTVTPWGWV